MSLSRGLTALAAASCEGLAVLAVLRGAGAPGLALHAISCLSAAAVLHRRLLDGPRGWSFALVFAGMLFVPILGPLGLVAVALVAPPLAASLEPDCVRTKIPEAREGAAAQVQAAADALAGGQRARLEALTAVRRRTDPNSVALLRRALEDPEEDVRLLAHALLESKSRAAYRGIDEATRTLEGAPAVRRGPLHRRLAALHWELAWLGLVEGECLGHALETARRHVLAALEQDAASASLHLLLGRIDLRIGAAEKAEGALLRAAELGLPPGVVRPYLAESAFLQRRFEMVRRHLAQAGPAGSSETVDRVRRYWT
jgi:polysaccharide biosynthesis protein PelE